MPELMRWDVNEDSTWELMQESEYGEWVLYEHHCSVVRDMKEQIWKLKDDLEAAHMEAAGYA